MVIEPKSRRKRPIAIDLFCGAGGMSLGFEQAGFDIVLGVDMDGYHVAAHDRNFPYGKTICESVAALTGERIFAAIGGEKEVDLIFGGPPCQGFSNMGLRDVLDPRNTLVSHFVRVVSEVRPRAFVMENVPGMLSGATRAVLDDAISQLEVAGYRIVQPARVLDASHFGVPQKRKRLILMGIRTDLAGELSYPVGIPEGSPPLPTIWEAIADLPKVDRHEELFAVNDASYDAEPRGEYARIMRGKSVDPNDYSHPRIWDSDRCTGCLRVRHSASSIALYTATLQGEMVPGHKLPKLDPQGLSPTLRAGSDSSHGSYTSPRPIHPFLPRCITAREAARLHGFPDWFAFYPLKWHSYRQIGNAVCPPLAKAIGAKIIRAIGYKPSKPTKMIAMTDDFHLPPERPRSLKRIPQVVHFPPVIRKLFEDRYDASRSEVFQSRFTFDEVREAIVSTGVQLTWVRADTFLPEIGRSRNVLRLLEPCLSNGYTIRKCSEGDFIGEFVATGHPEGIEVKSAPLPKPKSLKGVARGQETLF